MATALKQQPPEAHFKTPNYLLSLLDGMCLAVIFLSIYVFLSVYTTLLTHPYMASSIFIISCFVISIVVAIRMKYTNVIELILLTCTVLGAEMIYSLVVSVSSVLIATLQVLQFVTPFNYIPLLMSVSFYIGIVGVGIATIFNFFRYNTIYQPRENA